MIRPDKHSYFSPLIPGLFLAALLLNSSILVMSFLYLRALQAHGMTPSETRPFIFGTIVALIVATAGVTGSGVSDKPH